MPDILETHLYIVAFNKDRVTLLMYSLILIFSVAMYICSVKNIY